MSDEKNLEGQSFRNEALTGSGTVTEDGTYAEPLPDPTEARGLGARRTSGGRLLPDLPSAEIEGNGSPAGDSNPDTENAKPKTATRARNS